MERIGIFCLYIPSGEIDATVIHTLEELKSVVDYLTIVINGYVNKASKLSVYADRILIRRNIGFDIGAYKEVILSSDHIEKIKNSGELVLCNNSFYGPFISFQEIFAKMKQSKADFWGISSSEKNLSQHIQSYFLVLRRSVLEGEEFFRYLQERVDIEKIDYYSACSIFENGLFQTLKKAGYRFDAYKRSIDCDSYLNPYGSVKLDGLPILKKKVFSKEFYEKRRVTNALLYVKETYHFDIKPILNHAYRVYGIEQTNEMIEIAKTDFREMPEKDLICDPEAVSRDEIEHFIEARKKIFIYGNGIMARIVYSSFFFYENNPKLGGFVISDDQSVEEYSFRGYPVYRYSEVKSRPDAAFLVGLNKENTKELFWKLGQVDNVMYIWKQKGS